MELFISMALIPLRQHLAMNPSGKYTCLEYREEMLLLGLKRQLEDPLLPEAEKRCLAEKVRELEKQMGMD